MKKQILCITLLAGIMMLTGCGIESNVVINSDGTCSMDSAMYYTGEELQEMSDNNLDDYEEVNINNKIYYKESGEVKSGSWDDLAEEGGYVKDDKAVLCISSDGSSIPLTFDFVDITVKVPFDIAYSNFEITDKNTVKVDKLSSNIFISKDDSVTSGSDISFVNTKTNKSIRNKQILGRSDLYKVVKSGITKSIELTKIEVESSDSFVESARMKHDKLSINFNPYTGSRISTSLAVKSASFGKADKIEVTSKDGRYDVSAKLVSGVEGSCTYYVDTKLPTISVKNNKLTCIDKKKDGYASGIKSITVNGKSVKNGVKVKMGDKIVVKDKAGNVTKKTIK